MSVFAYGSADQPRHPLIFTCQHKAKHRCYSISTPFPVYPALSRVPPKVAPSPETRRAVPDMLFPPPWFPPLHPPFRGAPFQKEHGKGGNPSRGTQHGTFSFYVCRPSGAQNHSAAETSPHPPGLGGRVVPRPARHVQLLTRPQTSKESPAALLHD